MGADAERVAWVRAEVPHNELLCMALTTLMRVTLRAHQPVQLPAWGRVICNGLTGRRFPCEWLLRRVTESDVDGGGGKGWLEGVLMDCVDSAAREVFTSILLHACHQLHALPPASPVKPALDDSAMVEDAREGGGAVHHAVEGVISTLMTLLPAIASAPRFIATYLAIWLGLAQGPANAHTPVDGAAASVLRPGPLAWLLHERRVTHVLAHLYLGTASPDMSLPRLSAAQSKEPESAELLQCLNLVAQAVRVDEGWLDALTAPLLAKLANIGPLTGDVGDGVGLLVRLCKDEDGMVRLGVRSLLDGLKQEPGFYDTKEKLL